MITLFKDKNNPLTKDEMDNNFGHLSGGLIQVVSYLSTTNGSQLLTQNDELVHDIKATITPKNPDSSFLISVRWFGEGMAQWNTSYNILANDTRVNDRNNSFNTLAMASSNFHDDNDSSTPESLNFTTHYKRSVPGLEPIEFKLVAQSPDSGMTINTNINGTLTANDGHEAGTSEIIIMEVGAQV